MSDEPPVHVRARHQRALRRRLQHLERRVNAATGQGALSYDLQELEALRVALKLFALYPDPEARAACPEGEP